MAINNLNPRRTVWFSPYEPSNKYDIWLSKNAHYDENGESTTDSSAQRDCDYIFKIYDCGKWNPIVGFNSTAANKINTVTGTSYQYTFDSESYTSNGKQEFDLPLFTKDSPQELFSAGPLGNALNKFVTDTQWNTIYENHIKNIIEWNTIYEDHIKNIIEQYPFDLWHADHEYLGGIWADRFNSTYTNTSTWMAQCKYKCNAPNNYNLYVHAKDLIEAINTYTTENPNAPGIQPGGDFEWRFATTSQCGGIYSDIHPTQTVEAFKPVEVKFYPSWSSSDKQHRLCVSAGEIIQAIHLYDLYQYNNSGETSIVGGLGINVLFAQNQQTGNVTTGISIKHGSGDGGKFIRMKSDVSDIEWINPVLNDLNDVTVSSPSNGDLLFYNSTTQKWENGGVPGIQEYPTMTSSNHANGTSYVINGGGKPDTYLNSNGEWTVPVGTTYTEGDFIQINSNVIDIKPNVGRDKTYLCSEDGVVSWGTISQGGIYEAGNGIEISQENEISQNIEQVNTGSPFGQLNVSWTTGSVGITISGTDYSKFIGLYEYFEYTDNADYTFSLINNNVQFFNTNPIYLKINAKNLRVVDGTKYICTNDTLQGGLYLVTIQFGIIKFEEILTYHTSQS